MVSKLGKEGRGEGGEGRGGEGGREGFERVKLLYYIYMYSIPWGLKMSPHLEVLMQFIVHTSTTHVHTCHC